MTSNPGGVLILNFLSSGNGSCYGVQGNYCRWFDGSVKRGIVHRGFKLVKRVGVFEASDGSNEPRRRIRLQIISFTFTIGPKELSGIWSRTKNKRR